MIKVNEVITFLIYIFYKQDIHQNVTCLLDRGDNVVAPIRDARNQAFDFNIFVILVHLISRNRCFQRGDFRLVNLLALKW